MKEVETTGMEQKMMKLTLGITGTGKGSEDYHIPINVSRPRSGSGSRYLTDNVRHICCVSFSVTFVVFLLLLLLLMLLLLRSSYIAPLQGNLLRSAVHMFCHICCVSFSVVYVVCLLVSQMLCFF